MKFALLFQYDPTKTGPTEVEVEEWLALDKQIHDAGIHLYGTGFYEGAGRTVRVRGGAAEVTDDIDELTGEVVAGLYVIDVADADAATVWAERIPTARYGTVVVRPIVEYTG